MYVSRLNEKETLSEREQGGFGRKKWWGKYGIYYILKNKEKIKLQNEKCKYSV